MSKPDQVPHGQLLERKATGSTRLAPCLVAYKKFSATAENTDVVDAQGVATLVKAFNAYRTAVIYVFEGGENVPQENLRSEMMEEFFGWLFKDLFSLIGHERPTNYLAGKATSSYLTLTFAPKDFLSLFKNPNPRVSRKDQDFAIGATMTLKISPAKNGEATFSETITLPVVAIECKT